MRKKGTFKCQDMLCCEPAIWQASHQMKVCSPSANQGSMAGVCSAETYLLHWELLNLLLVLASTQLYTPNAGPAAGAHPFTEALLGAADLAPALLQVRPLL